MKKFFMSLNLSMILLLLTQLALPVAYAGLVYLSPNVSLDYTTVAFIVVMEVLMFFYGWKPLVELRLAEFSFDNCADAIHKLKRVSGSSGWREAVRMSDEIPSRFVRTRFSAFDRAISAGLHKSTSDYDIVASDFQNYINEDILRKDVANQSVSEALPGIMTGLGILGTFVGLVMGLQNFDSSSAAAIQESIPTLINGIRTAFLTSIAGLVLSLVYNMVYRKILKSSIEAMDDLVESVYGGVTSDPEEEARRISIEESIKQTEKLSKLGDEVGAAVAKSLKETVDPTMKEFSGVIERISKTADTVQLQAIEYIVDNFVERMNQSMSLKLEQFGKTMQEVGYWQMKNAEQLQKSTELIASTAKDLEKLNLANKDLLAQYENCSRSLARLDRELSAGNRQ